MIGPVGFVVIILAAIWMVVWMLRSPRFDKFCKDLTEGNLKEDKSSSKKTMNDISKAEKDLGKQADNNIKEAEKLKKESEGINEFLDKRGVSEDKEKEGS